MADQAATATARPGPVLVTGANSGFGLASVIRFAKHGWETWGTVRSAAKADQLREAAERDGVARLVRPVVLDVSDHDAIVRDFAEFPDFYGVVNNAGYGETGAIEDVSAARAKAQLDVNLVAPGIVSACALPGMRRLGGGRIVMVSSMAGLAAVLPLNGWYHASKFGLEGLSDALRVEVAGFNVKVSLVEPGFFKTDIDAKSRAGVERRPDDASSPYARAYERVLNGLDRFATVAPDPDIVARTIVTAVESRRPLRRYLLGADAFAVAGSRFLPRPIVDRAVRIAGGLR